MVDAEYDPFAAGPHQVDMRTISATDQARGRLFPIEIWSPAQSGLRPLIVFSHYSGGHRRTATYLCTHLASHGYVVAAMDHSEVVAPELAPRAGETAAARAARVDAIIGSRVPDVQFLLDHLLGSDARVELDAARMGLVGHSFGGWTVLAMPEIDSRVRSVVALAPGGSSSPKPGILPLKLTFAWSRDVPTLYLVAENDVPIPLVCVYELFDRTQSSKRMFILRRADHQHFIDDVEETHEAVRATTFPLEAAWIPAAMRPIAELSSGEQAHTFVRALTLAHFDATLLHMEAADRFLSSDVEADLAARGVEAFVRPDVAIN
jgi:predicted dienelactone hydrolase